MLDFGKDRIGLRQPAFAIFAARHRAFVRIEDDHAIIAQLANIALGCRMIPHPHIHSRDRHHLGVGCQQQGGRQIVGDSRGHLKLAFLLTEIVSELQRLEAPQEEVKKLNDDFAAFRVEFDGAGVQGLLQVVHAVREDRDVAVREHFGVVLVAPGAVGQGPDDFLRRLVDDHDGVEVAEADQHVAIQRRRGGVGMAPLPAMAVRREGEQGGIDVLEPPFPDGFNEFFPAELVTIPFVFSSAPREAIL